MTAHRMMPVAEILREATGSLDMGGIDWEEILANKVSHAHFDNLCDTLMREGFTMPIVLSDNNAANNGYGQGYTLGNGHHRLCAAILLGIDEIPVVITSGDFWCFEDSHDDSWDCGERSYEYWGMLRDNLSRHFHGDSNNEVHRAQFAGYGEDYEDDEPSGWNCEGCDEFIPDSDHYSAHLFMCVERGWEWVACADGYRHHFRNAACDDCLNAIHVEALEEHIARGNYPLGMWHPEYILADAYEQDAEWRRDNARRISREAWEATIEMMRLAINDGAGGWRITRIAEDINAAWQAYAAI